MADPQWLPVRGVLMTTQAISAYGGVRMPVELLEQVADQANSSPLPFHLDHDPTRPVRVRGLHFEVASRSDGEHELIFRGELHRDDREWLKSRRGMSATITTPIDRDAHLGCHRTAAIGITADHAWFDDAALVSAEMAILSAGVAPTDVQISRAFQFSFLPDPQIFVDVSLAVLTSMGASALWDAIKQLLRRRRTPDAGKQSTPTIVNISVTDGDRTVAAQISTDSDGIAKRAMDSFDSAVEQAFEPRGQKGSGGGTIIWSSHDEEWQNPPAKN